ncbi:ABC transporter ATP-binding protein [Agathobaculum sp. NSJ-28]|uniref:ABC transporter ATP-binding protein n=2 Tax=Agathobaculum TaxID=2048137 RepID=A0A923RXP3_9FIRM|nr:MULTISPECIES: ABC transporter ATP-binding protein [Butyricicoccaceae]MBS6883965.1 ABC transporter ATP-binding protein [Clostridiaceae bacterium]SCJ27368.1 LIV-I protein F [uncultured Butyricicoccus sp.]MBC5726541.1 ABC transporter ATP-binding protein [Agathobaculum faecis]MCU6789580.1 ABC transporter ATP-binding protein [Agathobaculum ammoniilyticum]WOC75577.1 ABC transporter ATP-binding protein [Intestinibacillus sp. NTUH-41-i26]
MLKISDLRTGYNGGEIVHGISLEVPDNQIVAIVGGNGAGKSTLIKAITGLIPLTSGTAEYNGEKLNGLSPDKIMQKGVCLVPEGRQLFPNMTVEDNLDIGSCTKESRKRRKENKEEMFQIFPRLLERRRQLTGTLSGGEQQMVAMARALMSNPKLLIMDEPSWGLAPILVTEMFQTIEMIRDRGTAILIVEQNVGKTLSISDWGYVIENGTVVMQDVGKKLLQDESLKKAYLGI